MTRVCCISANVVKYQRLHSLLKGLFVNMANMAIVRMDYNENFDSNWRTVHLIPKILTNLLRDYEYY